LRARSGLDFADGNPIQPDIVNAATAERSGKQLTSVRKAFAAASKCSGVHATPFTLRHTAAVWRTEDGISMSELAQLMGHSNEMTTYRYYARDSLTHMRKAANAGNW
jgi:integrase